MHVSNLETAGVYWNKLKNAEAMKPLLMEAVGFKIICQNGEELRISFTNDEFENRIFNAFRESAISECNKRIGDLKAALSQIGVEL